MLTKTCPVCGKLFSDPKHPDRKYCSLACSTESHKRQDVRYCEYCGARFVVQASKPNRFCSRKCSAIATQQHDPGKRKTCICEQCNREFETRHDHPGRFCSQRCRSIYAARLPKGKHAERVTVCCEICGAEFIVLLSYYRLRPVRFCSVECKNKANAIEKTGKGNPNYSGGTRFPNRGRNWWSQRRAALRRDNHTCQLCGRRPKIHERRVIDVHHIKPYKDFNGDYLAANELMNLITLCRPCHVNIEVYGYPCPQRLF